MTKPYHIQIRNIMRKPGGRTMKKTVFTCTEHAGTEDATQMILKELVHYINEKEGRTVVKLKKPMEPKKVFRPIRGKLLNKQNVELK
jgi:hypothetical protein